MIKLGWNVRDAIQATDLKNTLQGPTSFDENGDINPNPKIFA